MNSLPFLSNSIRLVVVLFFTSLSLFHYIHYSTLSPKCQAKSFQQ
nr:MAG TPA: hypothetical protein [Caudoviricetes sp.]